MSLPFLQPYLGLSNSLQTTASGGASWDWEDDFSYADQTAFDAKWAYINAITRGNPSTDAIDYSILRDGINASISYDLQQAGGLGSNLSDTAWVYRNLIQVTTRTSSNLNVVNLFGARSVSSSTAGDVNSSQDSLTIEGFVAGVGVQAYFMLPCNNNRETSSASVYTFTTASPTVGSLYLQTIRLSATTWSAQFFSNATYTTSVEASGSQTCSSGITSLRYIGITDTLQDSYTGQLAGTYNVPKIVNGVTTPP